MTTDSAAAPSSTGRRMRSRDVLIVEYQPFLVAVYFDGSTAVTRRADVDLPIFRERGAGLRLIAGRGERTAGQCGETA